MAVYVDDVRHSYGRMVMCHMWADTEEELLAMADDIGVKRKWVQGHPTLSHAKHKEASWVHFDISLGMKQRALALGAILTDKYGPSEHTSRLKLKSKSVEERKRGRLMLKRIEECRKLPRA